MAKKTDFPHELRHFAGVINSFRGHYYDYDIFRDFVDYTTAALSWNGDPKLADDLKHRYKDDYPRFQDLFVALVQTMADQIQTHNWYDALGTLYEVIASRNKCSWLGQFFTPAGICDLTAQITIQGTLATNDNPQTCNDPACGSGRTLMAMNAIRPGMYYIGQDLDPICTRMTAINMALHGMKGQALNGNTLEPDDFSFGYEINPRLYTLGGHPHIVPIRREQSYAYQLWQHRLIQLEQPEPIPVQVTQEPPKNLAGLPATQLSIF